MNKFLHVILSMLLCSCGQLPDDKSQVDCEKDASNQACSEEKQVGLVSISGSISGAFDVIVDGEHYNDIEAYYSAEIERLGERVSEAGYEDYSSELDAKLGFKDLTRDMMVYLSPANGRGTAAKAYVNYDDSFFFRLPSMTADGTYRLKAVKRISIVLTKDDEIKKFCFNFSAQAEVELIESKAEPIVLTDFESSVTKYSCEQAEKSGLDIPSNVQE